MSFLHLFALSLIQGLTEFLPVSSSGHLVLLPKIFGETDQGILIDVALHMGTLLAILVYYHRDLLKIAMAVLRWNNPATRADRNLGLFILLGSIPAVIVGAAMNHFFPDGIRSVGIITFNMVFFALIMWVADKKGVQEKTIYDVNAKNVLLMGLAQAIALVPGVSRSGITITAARFLGFQRVEAARFSFLLGIPAMAGAGLLSLLDIMKSDNPGLLHDAAIAAFICFFIGLAAIHFMMRWLKHAGLMPFVIYRILFGIFLLFFFII